MNPIAVAGPAHDVRTAIRQFVLTTALPGESPDNLTDRTPLRTSGILDSLATMGLVEILERRFLVELDVYETSVDRFDTVADMTACVERKIVATQSERALAP
jgi:acyl carrier protein